MQLLYSIIKWRNRKKTSDIKFVRVTSSGSFYMKSEDIFNDKKESLELLERLNKSLKKRQK